MDETALGRTTHLSLQRRGQYSLAFFVVAGMLYFVGFPVFLIFFFGVLTFFIWKAFSANTPAETKQVFEFYLVSAEILRTPDRRWFGFEVREAIAKGEAVRKTLTPVPPLVDFALGCLYQKAGDHNAAVQCLNRVMDGPDESAITSPSPALSEYVRVLRKIESKTGEAPLTSAAIRYLERSRRNKLEEILSSSRDELRILKAELPDAGVEPSSPLTEHDENSQVLPETLEENSHGRRTISELLHDIYDDKAV